ncbi:molybdopterin biosynthesis enzyme [Corynebacterium kutscheri]|uniref:Molybdopterin biosynthesis enzyme n=1 Tax=Corynebacterium kutscheri TaxID=35755 RepID=A0A0F6R1F1_9CORY|nr:molybdopterin-binding protein [Corynebacterium kutscheri]AKE41835.1 molybdopterin biosynthesis enzyme [Corynebacterium kutscheri]VEH10163.1 molybdenum cofactor biosynthesis protein MoaB [Corynebacterium kutscheri]
MTTSTISTTGFDDVAEPDADFFRATEAEQSKDPAPRRALSVLITDHVISSGKDTGQLCTELLVEGGFAVDAVVEVKKSHSQIRKAIETGVIGGVDLVLTVGATGVGPRDKVAEATREILDQNVPGIAQALRSSGLACGAVDACTSRGISGVSGSTVIVNLASSRAAIRDGMATLTPLVHHLIDQLRRSVIADATS